MAGDRASRNIRVSSPAYAEETLRTLTLWGVIPKSSPVTRTATSSRSTIPN